MTSLTITRTITCPICKTEKTFTLDNEAFLKWKNGTLTQNAFLDLDADDRESLISGICGTCWNGLFGREEG